MHIGLRRGARHIMVRWLGDPRLPLGAVLIMAIAAFVVLMRYAAVSDFRELALERLQDDSYYYLQPAWDFASRRFFSFDGEHPTYGFQPLWMLVLTFQAIFVPDKIAFVRAAVGLGALLYCLTGIGLFLLARRWMRGWAALLAPAVWLFNPGLAGLYLTGKENALFAFLLVASTVVVARRLSRPASPRAAWVDGVVIGLLVLSRVNAMAIALLFGAAILVASPGGLSERLRRTGWMALGAGAVLIVWAVYAWIALGAIFPNSGTAKLFGAWAALAVFIDRHVSWPSLGQIAALLPQSERIFLGNIDALVLPTRGLAESYFVGFLPEITLGALARLWPVGGTLAYKVRLILLGFMGGGFIAWLILTARAGNRRRGTMGLREKWTEPSAAAIVVGVLALGAVINGATNLMLLPAYLYWGTWYPVPEQVTLVLAAATGLWLVARGAARGVRTVAQWRTARRADAPPTSISWLNAVGGVLLAAGIVALAIPFERAWRPTQYTPDPGMAAGYNGVRWMNAHLPRGSRVASYSSGLLGYFAEGYTVINIDGLANTPQFVERETRGHLLYLRGLASRDPLIEYLDQEGITHLANVEPEGRIASGPYLGLVELQAGSLVYDGSEIVDWGPGEPLRRFIVVVLTAPAP
ncbi:MAG: hypothetical protein A2Z30_00810 [Chloroflexi bacterium RBG_16_64_43]|nr:MAG: hypothetical protein A2Z30_00810 [Chloroflexi bacterium RBG_16_64_43]